MGEEVKGFQKYERLVLNYVSGILVSIESDNYPTLKKNMQRRLVGDSPLEYYDAPRDPVLHVVFKGYCEIAESLQRLEDIEIYIGSFPYRNKSLSKLRSLRYHIENYFEETYILRERLKAYLTRIGRLYRGDSRHNSVKRVTRILFNMVSEMLEPLVRTRGFHTHNSRYTDNTLDRVGTFELLTGPGPGQLQMLAPVYKTAYKEARRKWKGIIKSNNEVVRQLLDAYADGLRPIVFDKSGKIIIPGTVYPQKSAAELKVLKKKVLSLR